MLAAQGFSKVSSKIIKKKILYVGNRADTWRIIEEKRPFREDVGGDKVMKIRQGGSFDPETTTLLQTVLDQAWLNLLPEQQSRTTKSDLAAGILMLAAQGERDPVRLRTLAVLEVVLAM